MEQSIRYVACKQRNVAAAYERFLRHGTRTGGFAALRGWLHRAAARAAVERRLRGC